MAKTTKITTKMLFKIAEHIDMDKEAIVSISTEDIFVPSVHKKQGHDMLREIFEKGHAMVKTELINKEARKQCR